MAAVSLATGSVVRSATRVSTSTRRENQAESCEKTGPTPPRTKEAAAS